MPIDQWFRGGLKEYLTDTITSETVKMLPEYDGAELIKMRDAHINKTADYAALLWMVANFIEWNRMFNELS